MCVYQLIFVFSIDCDNNSLANSEIQQFNNNDVILIPLLHKRKLFQHHQSEEREEREEKERDREREGRRDGGGEEGGGRERERDQKHNAA